MAGKLKGTMEATTPTGRRTFKIGTHFETKRERYQERKKKRSMYCHPQTFVGLSPITQLQSNPTEIEAFPVPEIPGWPRGTKRLWPPLRFGPPKDQASQWQRQLSRGLPASMIHDPSLL